MNKRSMKKGFPVRLLALLLCCFCLLSAIPTQVLATEGVTPPAQEEVAPVPGGDENATASQNLTTGEAPKTEDPKTEEPKTEEPKTEEPKTEEPKAEEPKTEEPKTEEPKTEEPKTEEPKTEEPKTEEPKTEEPKTEEPKTEEPKTEEPKTEEPTLSLYDRLMACKSVDEVNAILNGELTPEEEAEMDGFTQEQQDALQNKIAELGGYEFATLDTQYNTHSYTIQAGNTTSVSATVDSGSLKFSCSQSDITATRNSGGNGYTINVASSVPAGEYTLTVNYSSTEGILWRTSTTNYVDTVTITVTAVSTSDKNVKLNVVLDHTVATYAYYENGEWHWGETYTHGQTFSVYYKGSTDSVEYYVFFAKPETDYLLTTFKIQNVLSSTSGQQYFDLYSVENYNNSEISGFPNLASICQIAAANNYVTMNGYRTSANGSDSTPTEYVQNHFAAGQWPVYPGGGPLPGSGGTLRHLRPAG